MAEVIKFVVSPKGWNDLFLNPTSEIAEFLEELGEKIAEAARQTLGDPYVRGQLNPPPGPPKRRTGDLQASVKSEPPIIEEGAITINVTASSIHRGADYAIILRNQGYEFVNLELIRGMP